MSFLDHLQELRSRLIRAAAAIIIGFGVCVAFAERLFKQLAEPLLKLLPEGSTLISTGLPDPFFMYLKVAFVAGVFIVLPYIIWQLWLFIAPGLLDKERKYALPSIVTATLLFYLGAAFAYFVVFPAAFKFFLSYQTDYLKPMIAIREYVSLVLILMLAFGAVFETPVVIVFLGLLGIVNSEMLSKGRRYFIVLAFIIAAILTPTPDVINQTLMAGPMLLFYEISLRILRVIEKRRKLAEERLEKELYEMDDEDSSAEEPRRGDS
ncbi:MAG: twin-arginine translocase subunit TatC [Desulfomonilaceae bacterium]|nr:twin-arginine translocase subunit TatC [Desulfomonilaceae bacterium]